MHATGDQKFLETTGGAKLRSFDDSKSSIRAFLNLMANDERYKNVIESIGAIHKFGNTETLDKDYFNISFSKKNLVTIYWI